MSPDPGWFIAANLANPQSWNQYAYVTNDPLTITDPSGLCGGAAPTASNLIGEAINAIGNFFCNIFGGGGDQSSSNSSQTNAGGANGSSGTSFNQISFPGMGSSPIQSKIVLSDPGQIISKQPMYAFDRQREHIRDLKQHAQCGMVAGAMQV
jgi:hypothetical protein